MRYVLAIQLPGFPAHSSFFENKVGLEIGGPSGIFSKRSLLPVYPISRRVDNCNYATNTTWERDLEPGGTFAVSNKVMGRQCILEATDLKGIPDSTYDFVLSSHALEHIANPVKALLEWKRVLRNGGVLLLCLPDKRATFDHMRATTTIAHMIEDYVKNVGEDDMTHSAEVLQYSDVSMVPGLTHEDHAKIIADNLSRRTMHHHVFDLDTIAQLTDYIKMKLLLLTLAKPHHIVTICQKQA